MSLPTNLKQLGSACFSGSGIEKIIIPGSVSTIPSYCFSRCTQLNEIVIGEGVSFIYERVFEECNLKEIIFPKSMLSVHVELFSTFLVGKIKLVFLGNNTEWKKNNLAFLLQSHFIIYCHFGSKILQSSRQLGYEVHPINEYFDNK